MNGACAERSRWRKGPRRARLRTRSRARKTAGLVFHMPDCVRLPDISSRSRDGQSTIASLPLAPHTAYRRNELQAMYVKFEAAIEKLNQRVQEQAEKRSGAGRLIPVRVDSGSAG